MSGKGEDFGDRPKKLIAAFQKLDTKKTGKVPTKLVMSLLDKFETKLTEEEKQEFMQEADDGGMIKYESFVKDVVFGQVK